jgi:hypothetical protein
MRWFALALLVACGTNGTGDTDASTSPDAEQDAGSGLDASSPVDAEPMDAEAPADAGDGGVVAEELPPTNAAELRTWLEAGMYTSWAAESGPHDSTGPHFGDVRTFVNAVLDASLRDGNTEHPMGSASVKELYGSGASIRGYSVMVKTEAGSGGARWWWYERFNASTYAASQGDANCVPCHSAGRDHFLSPYPLQ